MIEVARQNTPITAQQAVTSLVKNWSGVTLTRQQAALLLSLVWIETAQGKAVQNFSPGNITAGNSWSGKVWRPPWFPEQPEGASPRNIQLHAAMLKGQAPSAFRAFDSIDEGFRDYNRTLQSSFPEVVEAAKTGDADTFRIALSKKYSGDYKNEKSTATFQTFQKTFLPMLSNLPDSPPKGPVASSPPLSVSAPEHCGFLSSVSELGHSPTEAEVESAADEYLRDGPIIEEMKRIA